MKKAYSVFILLIMIVLSGCSSNYSSVTQVEDQGMLQLSGDFWGVTLTLDSNNEVVISRNEHDSYFKDEKEVIEFPVTPGKHTLKISRKGSLIINRKVYIGNGNTFEVIVP